MPSMPMFPLGSVLFPHMPMPLRVFEPRYHAMLRDILVDEPSEFGVVLIERGQEVGGGDTRVEVGTVAQVAQIDTAEDSVLIVARGDRRFTVTRWLDDDPYPRAEYEELPELEWSDALQPLRDTAEATVRRAIGRGSDWHESPWPSDIELADEPVPAAWQLAGIAPLGDLDQLRLLRSRTMGELLASVFDLVTEAEVLP
jgi:uncharacterized protein